MDSEEAMRIAGGLRSSTRFALQSAAECKGGKWWTAYPVRDTALAQAGELTETGMAVRAVLLAQTTGERGE